MTTAHRVAVVTVLLSLLLATPRLLDTSGQEERLQRIALDLDRLQATNDELRRQNRHLREELEAFRTDPGFRERRVRDELHWARPDELMFYFTTGEAGSGRASPLAQRRGGER